MESQAQALQLASRQQTFLQDKLDKQLVVSGVLHALRNSAGIPMCDNQRHLVAFSDCCCLLDCWFWRRSECCHTPKKSQPKRLQRVISSNQITQGI